MPTDQATTPSPHLSRELGQGSALALNMLEMVGVGPFITLPLIVAAMGGPQAMLGWVLGACLALCDGLVWAELAAALPEAGGSYAFLREIYGPGRAGRLVSFLYVWQFTLTAPLVMASGAIGLAQYASYLYPALSMRLAASGPLQHIQRSSLMAVAVVALVVVLLYRRLRAIKRMAWVLWAGVILTLGITIVAGFAHFDARQAFSFPAGAFQLNHRFLIGLGAAMLIATYDYWGYYTIAYLAGEVRDPGRTLPRTIIGSILIIAALYLLMNISVLGVIPWQEFTSNRPSASHTAMVAELLGRSFGPVWAKVGAWLVIWTAFGSLFSLLLGASRVLWAAAVEGQLLPAAGTPAPPRRISGKRAFAAGRHRVYLLLLRPEGDHRCAGGPAHCAAILAAAGGRGAAAATTARYAAALPHLALSAPRYSGNARFSVRAGFAGPCRARDCRCPGRHHFRRGHVPVARPSRCCMALRQSRERNPVGSAVYAKKSSGTACRAYCNRSLSQASKLSEAAAKAAIENNLENTC